MQPLVVTLVLEPDAQERFDALRRRHFPAARNHLAAHVTLFHALPGRRREPVAADLAELAARRAFAVRVARVRSLGRGVAYDLQSAELLALRAELARRWADDLTPQDRSWHGAHVTVQNKVAPEAARALLADLAQDLTPHDVQAHALALWRYLGGPWEPVGSWPFSPAGGR